MSDEIINPSTEPGNILAPKLKRIHNSKIATKFHGSCLKQEKATFSPKTEINLFVFFRLDVWPRDLDTNFTLGDCLIEVVKLIKNADLDKYGYNGYDIEFDPCSQFLLPNGECGNMLFFFE